MRKPTVKKGPASYYAGGDETIVEIWSSKLKRGCLLSIREVQLWNTDTHGTRLVIEAYRGDAGVYVRANGQDYPMSKERAQ